MLIENHGNVAGKAENIVAIIKGAGPGWVGAVPDFGNFAEADRFHGLELLFPKLFGGLPRALRDALRRGDERGSWAASYLSRTADLPAWLASRASIPPSSRAPEIPTRGHRRSSTRS